MAEEIAQHNLPLILELLLSKQLLDELAAEQIMNEHAKQGCSLEEAILSSQTVPCEAIAQAYAEHLNLPLYADPAAVDTTDEDLKRLLPEKFCREGHVLPIRRRNGVLDAAFADPTDHAMVQQVQMQTGHRVNIHAGAITVVEQGLDALHGILTTAKEMAEEAMAGSIVDVADDDQIREEVLDLEEVMVDSKETKVIRLVNTILAEAMNEKASDIHMEPYPNECKIRFRVDGILNEMPPPPINLFVPIISRLKILSKMDIAEKRVPQDGSISMKKGDKRVDLRVSTVPTVYGEKMVMRLLNKEAVPLDLQALGFNKRQMGDFLEGASAPHGLLFVTGPTGSGKSTTLYATLNLIKSPKKNILTVEDPVEYKFVGINQVQVKPQVELTFARALRAFLRQDPDIIMVGEVRDTETAQICLRAALTGHFVLSTLHTNGALAAVTRLVDMGIEPFLIASTLRLLEAQRLVRRLCPKCKEPYEPDQSTVQRFHFPKGTVLYRPKGCKECREIGYKGRIGLYEVIKITPLLRELIQDSAPLTKLKEAARKEGMQLLADNGLEKVANGLTSLEELVSITSEE